MNLVLKNKNANFKKDDMEAIVFRLDELNDECIIKLKKHIKNHTKESMEDIEAKYEQSWLKTISFLMLQYKIHKKKINSKNIYCIFEYFLPLEGFVRTDVVLLCENKCIILEFKDKLQITQKDINQARKYKEIIKKYHKYTILNNLEVEAYIVQTNEYYNNNYLNNTGDIKILNKRNFISYIDFRKLQFSNFNTIKKFIKAEYYPAPYILDAIYNLFKTGKLKEINNIKTEYIENTYNYIVDIIEKNKVQNNKNIIFVSGVPGSGKTMIALNLLYEYNYKNKDKYNKNALYITPNDSLLNVIQYQIGEALKDKYAGKACTKNLRNFLSNYSNPLKPANFNLIIFDEAQRVRNKNEYKDNSTQVSKILEQCDKIYEQYNQFSLICFIGEGQSISKNEEDELNLWIDELKYRNDYIIFGPESYRNLFRKRLNDLDEYNENLNLELSLRNDFIDISKFIDAIIDCDIFNAKKFLNQIINQGYEIKITRNFNKGKIYTDYKCRNGLKTRVITSSKSSKDYKKIIRDEVDVNCFYMHYSKTTKWFKSNYTSYTQAATEFNCLGLEFDWPIVIWGDDFQIKNNAFIINKDEVDTIIKNSYRVLLTRSRKGLIIYIPIYKFLDETYDYLKSIGIEEL